MDNINILIIQVFAALATGGAVVAGRALGQHNEEAAGRSAWQMMIAIASNVDVPRNLNG